MCDDVRGPYFGLAATFVIPAFARESKLVMWLPNPLYEALPYIYVIIGALLIGGAVYIGTDAPSAPIYWVSGSASLLAGIVVFSWRMAARQQRTATQGVSHD